MPRTAFRAGLFCLPTEEDSVMTEVNRPEVEEVRQALGEFLDRLAKSVADGLARTKQTVRPTRGRSAEPPKEGTKSSG